jgi:ribosomal protein S3
VGQKIDARIFRLGIRQKNWEQKYIEKNNEETSLYLYKTLEIQKYINRIFALYKIKIHNCKIFYSENSLQIFISFYLTEKTINTIDKSLTKYQKKFSIRIKRLNIKKINKKNTFYYRSKAKQMIVLKKFEDILLESLALYTKKKVNILVKLQNLNNYKQLSYSQIKNCKTVFKQLKKFVRNSFFKEALNILFISISKRKSAKLLTEFISYQFKQNQIRNDRSTISRKDNYFVGFLKQSIQLLINAEVSRISGAKVVIKGRFNRAPRAKKVIMQFGKFSLQSINSKVDYHQSTAYTINGTFGIKI